MSKTKLKEYPSVVCDWCARSAINSQPGKHLSTWHQGRCGVCGETKPVTQPRDYGYPSFAGHKNP